MDPMDLIQPNSEPSWPITGHYRNNLTKLPEPDHEYFSKIPNNYKQILNFVFHYNLKKSNLKVVKIKLLKYRLECDPISKSLQIQAYVHYIGTLRSFDHWTNFNNIISDLSKIQFLSEAQRSMHSRPYRPGKSIKKANSNIYNSSGAESLNALSTQDKLEQEYQAITNVKFINNIIYDDKIIIPHYYSPYPLNDLKKDTLRENSCIQKNTIYICKNTLNFFETQTEYEMLCQKVLKLPSKSRLCYEIKAKKLKVYEMNPTNSKELHFFCQRLALFSKFFIDHKTLFFDNEHEFIFYVLYIDSNLIGYFSKELYIEDINNFNNLSCFVVLPQYQKQGYGTFLASLADLLAKYIIEDGEFKENLKESANFINSEEKREKIQDTENVSDFKNTVKSEIKCNLSKSFHKPINPNLSGPEFPLSPSGRSTYFRYWKIKIQSIISDIKLSKNNKTLIVNKRNLLANYDINELYPENSNLKVCISLDELSKITRIRITDLFYYLNNSTDYPIAIQILSEGKFLALSENNSSHTNSNMSSQNLHSDMTELINMPPYTVTFQILVSKNIRKIKSETRYQNEDDLEIVEDIFCMSSPNSKKRKMNERIFDSKSTKNEGKVAEKRKSDFKQEYMIAKTEFLL